MYDMISFGYKQNWSCLRSSLYDVAGIDEIASRIPMVSLGVQDGEEYVSTLNPRRSVKPVELRSWTQVKGTI